MYYKSLHVKFEGLKQAKKFIPGYTGLITLVKPDLGELY